MTKGSDLNLTYIKLELSQRPPLESANEALWLQDKECQRVKIILLFDVVLSMDEVESLISDLLSYGVILHFFLVDLAFGHDPSLVARVTLVDLQQDNGCVVRSLEAAVGELFGSSQDLGDGRDGIGFEERKLERDDVQERELELAHGSTDFSSHFQVAEREGRIRVFFEQTVDTLVAEVADESHVGEHGYTVLDARVGGEDIGDGVHGGRCGKEG